MQTYTKNYLPFIKLVAIIMVERQQKKDEEEKQ